MKCFRCRKHTGEDLFIRLERQNSRINAKAHPICRNCAVEFWRWADEIGTTLTYERVLAQRKKLEEREGNLKQREAEVRRMRRRLESELGLRELEVVERVR